MTPRLRRLHYSIINRLRRWFGGRHAEAIQYVGTDGLSGKLQRDLLKREGALPSSRVLEVGCGSLNAGLVIMRYLAAGIDPNEWLREAAIQKPAIRKIVDDKAPRFLSRDDFDASELGMQFDYVLSHSVLSHAAHWQLDQYLKNTAKVLAPGGRILASIRLAEGNEFGSDGSKDGEDSMDEEWVYPGVSWFKRSTVDETAARNGLEARLVPEHTAFYTRTKPGEVHDWIVFSKTGQSQDQASR